MESPGQGRRRPAPGPRRRPSSRTDYGAGRDGGLRLHSRGRRGPDPPHPGPICSVTLDPNPAPQGSMTLLERLGLHRKELRPWAMYDWANSAMVTTIVTAVFPIYFAKVAGASLEPAVATKRLADATTIGLAIIAVLSPILGAIADRAG